MKEEEEGEEDIEGEGNMGRKEVVEIRSEKEAGWGGRGEENRQKRRGGDG